MIVVLLCGCQSARAGTPGPAQMQTGAPAFFCERSDTNHAWSYQHGGIYVDSAGAVFSFQHGSGDQALLRVHADSVTKETLLARFAPGRTPAGTVPVSEMAERYAQALQAREGALSELSDRGADMGETVRRCYLPDAAGVYREVFLSQTGDRDRHNTSAAAAELSSWLDSIAFRVR